MLRPTSSSSAENAQKTVPTELTLGVKQVPNILNDTAVDANVAAKGYSSLVNVTLTGRGLTGILKLKEATKHLWLRLWVLELVGWIPKW